MLKRVPIIITLALFLAGLTGCPGEPAQPLRIGTNVWTGCEPLYLARELGHLDPKAVHLVEYPSATEVSRAFRNQAIDGMVISLDELFLLAQDDLQPRIVLVVDISHGGDAIVGRSGLRAIKDLKGKRVAVESGALGAYVLSRALALNQMLPTDVTIVHLEAHEHTAAFKQGRVDALVTFDPTRSELLRLGASQLFDSTLIPGEIVDLLAVRASALDKNPQGVKALLAGWFQAVAYLRREPKDAAARMGVRQQVTGAQFLQALEGLKIPSREDNLKMLSGDAPSLVVAGRRLMAVMLEQKLMRTSVSVEPLLAPGPLQSLAP